MTIPPQSDRIAVLAPTSASAVTANQLLQASNGLREPVLLRDDCGDTIAGTTWSLDYLFETQAETVVEAEFYPDADRRKPYDVVSLPLSELRDKMRSDPTKWYLAEKQLDELFGSVAAELPRVSSLPGDAAHVMRLVFFGTDTQSATHFHVRDQAILRHLRGKKRVILAGPECSGELATNSPFGGRPQFSTHGPEHGADALAAFTELCGDNAFQVDLEPGDSLFIPVHWWHWVEGQGECLSVTTFWRAGFREWSFPRPGVRAATAVALGETAKVVRRGLNMVGARRRGD